ncbi:MAG: hypothetical protein SOR31_04290 [Parvimonas sp.]|uniref:hypothetical protein n=1 Tax=Parvimonas sp. TaxID=1944660 RepID=UPI002A74B4D5|nr:hypothetical protein [Parvimonas sp.]MDY3050836.1 hypothetical protein [Parvimonas sp.]
MDPKGIITNVIDNAYWYVIGFGVLYFLGVSLLTLFFEIEKDTQTKYYKRGAIAVGVGLAAKSIVLFVAKLVGYTKGF